MLYHKFNYRLIEIIGGVTDKLMKALYGCVESSGLWYENFRATMLSPGYTRNVMDVCVFNKTNRKGVQCTVCVYVGDLMIMSKSKSMIHDLTQGLTKKYGPVINYLGMVFNTCRTGQGDYVRIHGRTVRGQEVGPTGTGRSTSMVPGQASETGAAHSSVISSHAGHQV
jgi:Reverse transcriptase (RNA-dependent DNA polymerase)